jgi:hypothetical protein
MRKVVLVFALVLSVALPAGLVCYQLVVRPFQFAEERKAIERRLHQWWEGRPPPGVDPHAWKETWGIVYNGFGNVCFSPKHVSLPEMRRLRADLEAKMHRPATVASLRWFWDRLAETGPHGKQYIEQMTLLLDEAVGQLPPDKNGGP